MPNIRFTGALASLALPGLFFSAHSFAGEVTLAWDASTGPSIGGYKIVYGQQAGNYSNTVDVGNQLTYTLPNLADGQTYYIAIKAYDSARSVESTYSNEVQANIPAAGAVTAAFTATPASGAAPLTVQFAPTVTGTVQSWKWEFGDGTDASGASATVPSETKTYAAGGTYYVTLTVTGAAGTVTKTMPVTVAPAASFAASATAGPAPLTVRFTDNSTGRPTAWNWNFGDNTTSAAQNPSHSYASPGTYTVSLKVTAGGVTSTNAMARMITVGAPGSTGGGTGTGGTTGGTISGAGRNAGLVAAFGFEEASGSSLAADASAQHNHGRIASATQGPGRYGKALAFNGSSSQIVVPNASSLALSGALTLEAWVKPAAAGHRSVLFKEAAGASVYDLYASKDGGLPSASVSVGDSQAVAGTALLPADHWSYLTTTYDGQVQRLYVNGTEVGSHAQTGPVQVSDGALKIGGNDIWGDWFAGSIDEVRIYQRALAPAEIQADMYSSVASVTPPRALVGERSVGSVVTPLTMGTATAARSIAAASGLATRISVYVDASSAPGALWAGIYTDNQGHPGVLMAEGRRDTTVPGRWNAIALPAVALNAGTPYWIAALNPKTWPASVVTIRTTTTSASVETSQATDLDALPWAWTTGTSTIGELPSANGAGY